QRNTILSKEQPSYTIHRNLLQQFVQYDITHYQPGSTAWDGELSRPASTILFLHATQKDLSPFHQDLAQWLAYSKLYQSLEFSSSLLLHLLTSIEYQWALVKLQDQHKRELAESFESILEYGISLLQKYREVFPLSSTKPTERLQSLLRVLVQMCKMKAFCELCTLRPDLQQKLGDAIESGTIDWYKTKKQYLENMVKNEEDDSKALLQLVNEVHADLQNNLKTWNKVFLNTAKVDIFNVTYIVLQKLMADEVKKEVTKIGNSMSQCTAETFFQLYLVLKEMYKQKDFLQNRDESLALTGFHEWFREALPKWLQKAYSTAQERVQRAVQVDQIGGLSNSLANIIKLVGDLSKHSTSAVDLATCFAQVKNTWQKLDWPDPEEAFMIMVKLTEDLCKIALMYCRIIKNRAEELSVKGDEAGAANKLCVVVNNIEQLRLVVLKLPEQLDWNSLQRLTDHVIEPEQIQNTLYNQLHMTSMCLDREIRSVVQTLAQKLHAGIDKHIRNLAAANDSRPVDDMVVPLMKFLESELAYMSENLVQENFNSLLALLWIHVVNILTAVSHQQVNSLKFYQRLQYALESLNQCFHAGGDGLPVEKLHTENYEALKTHLKLNTSSSRTLIQKYLENKIQQQYEADSETYGEVTIKGSYKYSEQKLRIDILNAVRLKPLDSNDSSDPFVQLTLEPKHIFPEVEMRTTECKMKDLNPLFDETFEFLVTPEQCKAEGACLVLTVYDYDYIGANDLEGEAFFSLYSVPGLNDEEEHTLEPSSVPQTRLALTHPKPNEDNILKLLENRKGDKEAQAFVKLRKQRIKQSMAMAA
uniref:Unc-13 homolog D n=1 Tax=Latimeria chalumnae TaxID=7897 RepID=H3B2M3_LATCH